MSATADSEGARWVDRFFLPIVGEMLDGDSPHRCLQLAPNNEEEATHLRSLGWTCDLVPAADLDAFNPSTPYDLLLTGALGLVLEDPARRGERIKRLGRACRDGGGLLVVIGNRRCPLDLTGNAPKLHGPGVPSLPTMASLQHDFVANGPFSSLHPFAVNGHFGSTGDGTLMSLFRGLMNWNWRHFATPRRRWAYASPFNPTLVVWIRK